MKYDVFSCQIIARRELTPGVFDFYVHNPELAELAQAGQFANIRVEGKQLRRPISICDIDQNKGLLRFIIEKRGEGTEQLCLMESGQNMDMLAPLGNGFRLPSEITGKALFVGGGIGVPPLLYPARKYASKATVILGFRSSRNAILISEFAEAGCQVRIATDDGSMGHHGLVTELVQQAVETDSYEQIYACGPTPMLRALSSLAENAQIPCQVSLEERMACGIGACLVCACKSRDDGHGQFKRVCRDGPVFDSREVEW